MWLILTDQGDLEGSWLAAGLAARGLNPVESVTTDQLLGAARLSHRVGAEGAWFSAELTDGRVIDSRRVRGTINRIGYLPPDPTVAPDDAEYVLTERNAAVLSMLSALPGLVLNPATPNGLSGAWRQPSQWMALAGRAGLAHLPFDSTEPHPAASSPFGGPTTHEAPMVITLGDEVVDTGLDAETLEGCRRLAHLARTPMLGIEFGVDPRGAPGRLLFAGANPRPNLRLAGEPILDALAYVFEKSEQGADS